MDFEEALRAELSAITELNNKVFPLNATQGTKAPYVVYMSSEGVQYQTLDGYLPNKEVECEINILHGSYGAMKSLTKEVIAKVLSFYSRTIGENGPFIESVSHENPVELYENEISAYRSVVTIIVNFRE
ncbi:DUF3168 domain-containing protein [Neobacillus vireti]|uniref:DUF3168 domain-containing protein n=1 Tax=Neobacillus vireti TaxID=220686 RepID=UPI002FFFEF93